MKGAIEGRIEGKGKPNIMLLDDIKGDETYEKIKRRAMDRKFCLEPGLKQNTNDDEYHKITKTV